MNDKHKRILDTIYQMYPEAVCELDYKTNEQLAIAVILSAQTTDKLVNTVTPKLFSDFPNMHDLARADVKDIENSIHRIGLYHSKAKNLKAFAQTLVDQHQGILPSDFESLTQLSGVGQKTAQVIQAVGFNIPALAVDTHVHRVALRLGLVKLNSNVFQTERQLKKLIPQEDWIVAHHRILFFGRYHCQAKKPLCERCPLNDICRFHLKQKKTSKFDALI